MNDTQDLHEQIRTVLEGLAPGQPQNVKGALDRIMDIVEPFRRLSREELERYRDTFAELAK